MTRFDLVIFDCDGVVVDSEKIMHRVFGDFIRSLGADVDEKRMKELFLGRRLADCIAIVEDITGRRAPPGSRSCPRPLGARGNFSAPVPRGRGFSPPPRSS